MLNVALPKGRLGEDAYNLMASVGLPCPEVLSDSRKLVFENPEAGVRYLMVKPSDVGIYVERGVADVGIVGSDILLETSPDVYELLDTGIGKCRMVVSAVEEYFEDPDSMLRVATKYPVIARDHYMGKGREIEVIKLGGSIEIAPILGLSDVIVDIVQSGNTLKENHLKVLEEFLPISARFIANKSSYMFLRSRIDEILGKLKEVLEV